MRKTNLLVSTAVGVAFVVAGPAAMALGKKHPNGAKGHLSANLATSPFKASKGQPRGRNGLRLRGIIDTWGVTTANLPGGYVVEDAAQTFKCKAACTIITNSTAEFMSYYSYNQASICPVVDGYYTNGACFFSGALSPQQQYTNRQNQTNLSVASGTHTVQTYIYTIAPAYLGHYQNDEDYCRQTQNPFMTQLASESTQDNQDRRHRNIEPDVTRSAQDERQCSDHRERQPPKPAPGRRLQGIDEAECGSINAKECHVLKQSRFR